MAHVRVSINIEWMDEWMNEYVDPVPKILIKKLESRWEWVIYI